MTSQLQLQETWFYRTALKSQSELQNIFVSESDTTFSTKSYIISGNAGIGKTTSAVLIARNFVIDTIETKGCWNYKFEPDFISYYEFRQMLSDREFGNDELKSKAYYRLQGIKETPFLIFDDLRAEKLSEYHKNQLDNALLDLFSHKFANKKNQIVVITSNATNTEIKSIYSEAVCSRIFGMCEYLEASGIDKRLNN